MIRAFLIHAFFMILGYALAVLVSTTVVLVCMGLPTLLPDQGHWGSFFRYLNDFPATFLGGLMLTATYGLPGWLISVIIAEFGNRKRKFWFAFAGVLTAALALLLSGFGRNLFSEGFLNLACLMGGFFGGLTYWAIAGKHSGNWKIKSNGEDA